MHFNTRIYDFVYDMPADANENFPILLQPGLVDTTILPIADVYHQPIVDSNTYQQQSISAYGGEHRRSPFDDVDMLGERFYSSQERHFENLLTIPTNQVSQWKTKHINEWTGADTTMWILDTGIAKKMKVAQIPTFTFSNVTGLELSGMSKETFCEILNTNGNIETTLIGDVLYEELQNLLQEAVVPATVIDKYNGESHPKYSINNDSKLLDMDSLSNNNTEYLSNKPAFSAFSDSGYDSLSDDYDGRGTVTEEQSRMLDNNISSSNDLGSTIVVKRPPGRPKGSGKKLQKRIKNVSVPEFLRDLLLDSRYCPRIIKWEDYSMGKFRFVRANEVAELWGGKKNNPKMSFEKFSRAMRYHYKQEVLVSVPTARLVYQFGPKAPQFTTPNPNFESPTLSPRFNSR